MTLEEMVRRHREISQKIDELEKEKKALGLVIMEQMEGKSLKVADYLVRRIQRLSISVSIEEARSYNATKMEECVDKEKIKLMYSQGKIVPGVSEIQYIQVTQNKVQI